MKNKKTSKLFTILIAISTLLAFPHSSISQSQLLEQRSGVPEPQIKFNFQNAPLGLILEDMSRQAGFVFIKNTDVQGVASFFTEQPVGKETAVEVLTTLLANNGYALLQNGDVLTVLDADEARGQSPIITGSTSANIPRSDRIVTQIIPIKHLDAIRLINNLRVLIPDSETITANESSNSVIITDTQANIRRLVEIIEALDTSISSIATLKVFPLSNADAVELAEIVEDLFETSGNGGGGRDNRRDRRGRDRDNIFQIAGGDGNAVAQSTGNSAARAAAMSVTAVADERTNSLVVSAPESYVTAISTLIEQIDTVESELTDTRVFFLANANAAEVVEHLNEVFDEDNTGGNNGRNNRGRNQRNRGNNGNDGESGRTLALNRVVAVADMRTNAVIVDASPAQMAKAQSIIDELDSSQARKKGVRTIQLDNADGSEIVTILEEMFSGSVTGPAANPTQESVLAQRRNGGASIEVSTSTQD